jgi:gentisate 1,2-dioxygenase
MTSRPEATPEAEQQFYAEIERNHLAALWNVSARLMPREPTPRIQPYLWRWKTLRTLCLRSGELTPIEKAERRVLGLINPGLKDKYAATETLWAAVQLILPGENAPAHRHSAAAIRFIIEGSGAYTTVEGDKCIMDRGDMVLTPAGQWHDHGNESRQPMIWMDGLDLPIVRDLDAVFVEHSDVKVQKVSKVSGGSERRFDQAGLKPAWEPPIAPASPLLNYKWAKTEAALRRLAQVDASPFDDVALEYVNPTTGGPVLPTLACWIQLIRPGVHTRAHRQTSSSVYHVFEGRGYSVINGRRFDWERGDFFIVPPWAWHEHASADGEAILFSVHDTPILTPLGLYREEAYPEAGGHQQITGVFEG